MTTSLDELTERLMHERYVDNEVDARLAAIHILVAADAGAKGSARAEPRDTGRRAGS